MQGTMLGSVFCNIFELDVEASLCAITTEYCL
uniref:Uncharacterized protein n=1 Tax=Arundo donax TaxID=35708 RepID=A0A0A9B721_ARUDO